MASGTVTTPGSGGNTTTPISYSFGSSAGLSIAQQIANALASAGHLSVTSSTGGTITAPTTVSGTLQDLQLTGSPTSSIPAGYNVVQNNNSGASTITAGPGTSILSSTGGGLFVLSGPATIAAAGGNNVISQTGAGSIQIAGGTGNNTITAGGTGGTVAGGTGTDLITLTATATGDTVMSIGGTDTIASGGSGNLIQGSSTGPGSMVVTETGTNDTILGGANPMTVTASTATRVFAGAGSLTFVGGAGTATVLGGSGADSVSAGTGGVVFADNTATNATVNSSAGAVTIFGSSGATVNLVGNRSSGKPDVVVAGSGNETLNAAGSSAPQFMAMGSASVNATMIAGTGNDTMVAGAGPGSATMTGGVGSDTFVFFSQSVGGAATDVIKNFTASDSVFIEGYGPGSAAALQQNAKVGAGGVTLTLSDGTSVTFANLTSISQLNGKIQYG